MKRTFSALVMLAVVVTQISSLSAGAGSTGVISGTMRGPAGPVAGVRVNALNNTGAIVGSAVTNGAGSYSLDGLPVGTFVVQAVSPAGSVMTTSTATLSSSAMKAVTNLSSSAVAARNAQSAAVQGGAFNTQTVWWMVGASAATAGIISAVALEEDASPVQ
jgi:hypothetical protein